MSEQDEQRPLTRRERRIRDLGETGAMDLSEAIGNDAAASDAPAAAAASEPAVAAGDVEISPFHEDGTPRSRREMRQLREEALAALGGGAAAEPIVAETVAEAPASEAAEAAPETLEPIVVEPIDEVENDSVAETAAEAQPAPETKTNEQDAVDDVIVAEPLPSAPGLDSEPEPAIPDFDSLMSPPTEPFTVDELREAEAAGDASVDPVDARSADGDQISGEAQAAESAGSAEFAESAASQPVSDDAVAAAVGDAPAKSKRRFPWQRSKSNDQVADAPVADSEPAVPEVDAESASAEPATTVLETAAPASEAVEIETVVDDPAPAQETPAEATPVEAAPVDAALVEVLPAPAEPAEHLPVVEAEPAADPVPAPEQAEAVHPDQRTSYSFPDIAPPEEWRSVFDDPSGRQFPTPGDAQGNGDFDDLISRAVAQEGSTGGTGTSALILPTMPEDTGGLTGPLGATGDMYVTGSLKLPKSLGETGGHSALHDSIEMDPITGDQLSEPGVSSDGPAPVSARHAVSARVDSGVPVVAKPTREKSKLPLVLSLTGGGLLVVVVGLGAWGASNGFFG
ncbi:hypothetical protein ACFWHR_10940 [Leucobacter sp. NPDC058333]|uniref:hypothetical protein n=1 Tax=Leucobacter sp. NPDC058333 TaxID=3346450 RepID=UPI00365E2C06